MTSSLISRFIKAGALLAILAFAITACLPNLSAQELSATKGGLAGLVTDSSGAVVPGAGVTVTGNSDTRKANDKRHGALGSLGPDAGTYTISVEREGFSKVETKAVSVEINRVNSVNLSLEDRRSC